MERKEDGVGDSQGKDREESEKRAWKGKLMTDVLRFIEEGNNQFLEMLRNSEELTRQRDEARKALADERKAHAETKAALDRAQAGIVRANGGGAVSERARATEIMDRAMELVIAGKVNDLRHAVDTVAAALVTAEVEAKKEADCG